MRRAILLVLGGVAAVGLGVVFLLASGTGRAPAGGLHITGMLHVNVNCRDFERSRRFYELLGFKVLMEVEPNGSGDVAAAVALGPAYVVRGALMAHADGSAIDLLEWREPRDERPPYEKLNHLGIGRIALTTTDLDADVERLKAAGVTFRSDRPAAVPDPFGETTRFICFEDPDGTVIELVELGTAMGLVQRASKAATRGVPRSR